MRKLIHQNLHKKYVRYNALTNAVEPVLRHEVSFRTKRHGGRGRTRYVEVHDLKPHPLSKRQDETDIHAVSRLVDPLHGVLGTPSQLGSFIQLKVLPNVLNICIKKGVQRRALFLLARRILEQNQNNSTHLQIKRMQNGRYVFKSLYTNQQLGKHSPDTLAEAIMKLLKGRKYLHLVAKPSMRMYKSFDEKHLLGK